MKKPDSTKLKMQFFIEPVENLKYEIGGLLGNTTKTIIQKFYSENIAKKLNVIVSELANNVIENISDKKSHVELKVSVDGEILKVSICNKVPKKQYNIVKNKIDQIRQAKNIMQFLTDTIKERREKNLSGGLGLIRLTSETKARTSVSYNEKTSYMTINVRLILKEII